MSVPPPARPVYVGAGPEPAFGLFHPAAGSAAPRLAVLLCPPFGWEDMCSYRSRRDWAEHLAAEGRPTLRLELPGTGDSPGGATGPGGAGRLDAWSRAVADAARWLRATDGSPRVVALGIGLGGMLAVAALAAGAPIDELVLWATPARGRTLLRELRAFGRMEDGPLLDAGVPDEPPLGAGSLAAGGYVMSPATVAALEALDLTDAGPLPAAGRALLLERDGIPPDRRLHAALEAAGTPVTVAPGPGYAAMLVEPQEARPPRAVFAAVSAWLDAGLSPAGDPAPAAAPPAEPVAQRASVELECGGDRIRETPLALDRLDPALFGVLAEPTCERAGLTAVLLNAGPQRRTGPNRMWVEIARRWAARGVPTLRVDLAGIGDADGDTDAFADVAAFYVPEYVGQVRAVLDELEARGLPGRFVLVGLCSGAYWSLHTAAQDPRVAAVQLLNPRALIWDPWVYARREGAMYRGAILRAGTWRRIVRGEVDFVKPFVIAGALLRRAALVPFRLAGRLTARRRPRAAGGDELDLAFDALRDRGTAALLLFAGDEPLHADFEREGRLERLDRWPNLRLEHLPVSADTHTLRPVWLQRQVHEIVDRALEAELARTGPGRAAAGAAQA
jgi:alpha-beta hydrolase superfamily lysophospholipase